MLAYLRENFHSYRDAEGVGKVLNLTPKQILNKVSRMHLPLLGARNKRWTQEEYDLLEFWAESKTAEEISRHWRLEAKKRGWPKRSSAAVRCRYYFLGLSRGTK